MQHLLAKSVETDNKYLVLLVPLHSHTSLKHIKVRQENNFKHNYIDTWINSFIDTMSFQQGVLSFPQRITINI